MQTFNRLKKLSLFIILFYFFFFDIVFTVNSSCIEINTAPQEELEKITGIGPVLAQKIIEARPFSSINELTKVPGIGEVKLAKIKEQNLICNQAESPKLQVKEKNIPPQVKEPEPKISLSHPETSPVNKEIKVTLSASNLKNAAYDVKISIEKEKALSDIYNEKEDKWQSSHYYVNNFLSGASFEKTFILKLREEGLILQGETDIMARIRESGKNNYLEYRGKINLTKPERKPEDKISPGSTKDLAAIGQQIPEKSKKLNSWPVFPIALILALFSGIIILILKRKLKSD